MGLGGPICLAIGVMQPALWMIGFGWIVLWLGLMFADALMGMGRYKLALDIDHPKQLFMGDTQYLDAHINFTGRTLPPSYVEYSLATSDLLKVRPASVSIESIKRQNGARFELTPVRRGDAVIEKLWFRWQGPFGLVWKQRTEKMDTTVPVVPNIRAVKDEAIRIFSRDANFGQKIQIEKGEGTEFDALRDFVAGMDKRSIDWKHSARHKKLTAKEYRTERNHNIIFALDTGRIMSEPLRGVPKVDWALNASLLLSYVGLKLGDRVGIFSFDSHPRLSSKPVSSVGAFPYLQRLTSEVDYSSAETNFTLGLSALSQHLERRSLIVVFTDFPDTTSAELMLENVSRLIRTHLVIFVAFRDEELETMMDTMPEKPEDVSRAVIAHNLLKERELVLSRLQRMGVQIIDAPVDAIGPDLISRYLELKRRDQL